MESRGKGRRHRQDRRPVAVCQRGRGYQTCVTRCRHSDRNTSRRTPEDRVCFRGKERGTDPDGFSDIKDDTLKLLKRSGLFALIRQRPFDSVPFAGAVPPRDIFVTAFDTAPLAPSLISEDVAGHYDAGIKAISTLTSGKVYPVSSRRFRHHLPACRNI